MLIENIFPDATPEDAYYQAAATLYNKGVISGYGETVQAGLNDMLNRAQAVKILTIARGMDVEMGCHPSPFPDVHRSEKWYSTLVLNA